MTKNSFSEKDLKNATKLLNFVAKNAEFKMDTAQVIEYFGLMAWAQQELVAKIKDNILEVKAVHTKDEPAEKKQARRSRSRK
mgnify:FL=1